MQGGGRGPMVVGATEGSTVRAEDKGGGGGATLGAEVEADLTLLTVSLALADGSSITMSSVRTTSV